MPTIYIAKNPQATIIPHRCQCFLLTFKLSFQLRYFAAQALKFDCDLGLGHSSVLEQGRPTQPRHFNVQRLHRYSASNICESAHAVGRLGNTKLREGRAPMLGHAYSPARHDRHALHNGQQQAPPPVSRSGSVLPLCVNRGSPRARLAQAFDTVPISRPAHQR